MIETRQEINSLLVSMTEQELAVVKMICEYLIDHREDKAMLIPILSPMLMLMFMPDGELH